MRAIFPLLGLGVAIGVAAGVTVFHGDGWGRFRQAMASETAAWPAMIRQVSLMALSIIATCSTAAGLRSVGGRGSEPATAAMLVATGVAAACRAGLPEMWQDMPWLAIGWLAAGALVVGGMAWVSRKEPRVVRRARGRTAWLLPLPSQGRLRPVMTGVVMAVSLAAMAVLLVPQPPQAARYAAFALAAMIALAVPQMTLADGVLDRSAWAMVFHPPRCQRTGGPGTAPTFPPPARIGVGHAAIVVWPLVVAGGLACRRAEDLLSVSAAAVTVFGIAGLAAIISRLARRGGGSPETAQAIVLGGFAVMACWLLPALLQVFPSLAA